MRRLVFIGLSADDVHRGVGGNHRLVWLPMLTSEERAILEWLDRSVWSPTVQTVLKPIVRRVTDQLTSRHESVMAWEPISLITFGSELPCPIQSAWIFILRAGVNTGAERHPN